MTDRIDQASGLEAAIRKEASAEAEAMLEAAKKDAASIIMSARKSARTRMKTAVVAIREERNNLIRKARTKLSAAERERELQRADLAIQQGMGELENALALCWKNKAQQTDWARGIAMEAAGFLLPGKWTVEHPSGWRGKTDTEFLKTVTDAAGEKPVFRMAKDISAGIRICADGAMIDGTISGLLSRRTQIESRLLALIAEERERSAAKS